MCVCVCVCACIWRDELSLLVFMCASTLCLVQTSHLLHLALRNSVLLSFSPVFRAVYFVTFTRALTL